MNYCNCTDSKSELDEHEQTEDTMAEWSQARREARGWNQNGDEQEKICEWRKGGSEEERARVSLEVRLLLPPR